MPPPIAVQVHRSEALRRPSVLAGDREDGDELLDHAGEGGGDHPVREAELNPVVYSTDPNTLSDVIPTIFR